MLAVILCILLVGGGVKLYSDKKYTLHNPKIEDDSSTESGKKVTWDCLWFGSYPQSVITEKDGEIYTTLKNTDNWDKNGDATIDNIKYHKTKKGYFKYEPIKWRVLQSENGDGKKYGFLNDETRKCKTNSFSETEVVLWWLSTGDVSNSTALVYEGSIIGEVYSIDYDNYGVRPALHLNLLSSNLFSYAGTVSSDGTKNEVPYNTKTKLVQK